MTLGEKIQNCRKRKGMSQEDLANVLGVSRQAVQKWESGMSIPEVNKLIELSNLFDVSLDWLIKDVDEEKPIVEERKEETSTVYETKDDVYTSKEFKAMNTQRIISLVLVIIHFVSSALSHILMSGSIFGIAYALGANIISIIGYVLAYSKRIKTKGIIIFLAIQVVATTGLFILALAPLLGLSIGIGLNILYIVAMILLIDRKKIEDTPTSSNNQSPIEKELDAIKSLIYRNTISSLDKAYLKIKELLDRPLSSKEKEEIDDLTAYIYRAKGDLTREVLYYQEALRIYEELGNIERADEVKEKISLVVKEQEDKILKSFKCDIPIGKTSIIDLIRVASKLIRNISIYNETLGKTERINIGYENVKREGIDYFVNNIGVVLLDLKSENDLDLFIRFCDSFDDDRLPAIKEDLVNRKKEVAKKFSKRLKIVSIVVGGVIALAIILGTVIPVSIDNYNKEVAYETAEKYLLEKRYDEALIEYNKAKNYKDVEHRKAICGQLMFFESIKNKSIIDSYSDSINTFVSNNETVIIYYNPNKDSSLPSVESKELTITSFDYELYNPTIRGYEFGWVLIDYSYEKGLTKLYLEPHATIITYVIKFNNVPATMTVPNIHYNVNSSPIHTIQLAKQGYVFGGWYSNSFFMGEPVTVIDPSTTLRDINLYAKWDVPLGMENLVYEKMTTEDSITYIRVTGVIDDTVEEIDVPISFIDSTGVNIIKEITYNAFATCNNLKKISLPFIGKYSGYSASYNNEDLKFKSIFDGNIPSLIETIVIKEGCLGVSRDAFLNIDSLKEIYLPSTIQGFGESVFSGCDNLEAVHIASGAPITKIERSAFSSCYSLKSFVLPNGVVDINNRAFSTCYEMEYLVVPQSLLNIYMYAFEYCSALNKIFYMGTLEEWNNIRIDSGNNAINTATKYFYSEQIPTTPGNYWHYVDGVITIY